MQSQLGERWKFCGSKFPKEVVIYFCQVFIVYIVVISSIVYLCIRERNIGLWSSLASGSVGYLLPNPSITRKEMKSFHLILPSNSSRKTHPDKTLNHYVTAISNRIELDVDWEVALSEISFQRTWYNIQEYECMLSIIMPDNEIDMFLPEGFYSYGYQVVDRCNRMIERNLKLAERFSTLNLHTTLLREKSAYM